VFTQTKQAEIYEARKNIGWRKSGMKYWGTLVIASALMMAAYAGGLALAEESDSPSAEASSMDSMAMPMQVPDDDKIAGVQRNMPSSQQAPTSMDTEKAKLSVDMDQTAERLEAKIYEMKTEALNVKGPKKKFQMHQKIKKLEGQKTSVQKMHHKVSKNTDGRLSKTKNDWDSLKSHIDQQLDVANE
jgi:hypothetical protein